MSERRLFVLEKSAYTDLLTHVNMFVQTDISCKGKYPSVSHFVKKLSENAAILLLLLLSARNDLR